MNTSTDNKAGPPRTFTLRAKMLSLFGAVFTLSVIAFGLIIISGIPFTRIEGMNDALRKDTIKELSLLADMKKDELLSWLSERRGDMRLSADSTLLREHVHNLCEDIAKHVAAGSGRDRTRKRLMPGTDYLFVTQHLRTLADVYGTYDEIMIADTGTWIVAASINAHDVGRELSAAERFTDVLSPGRDEIIVVRQDLLKKKPYLYIVRAIKSSGSVISGRGKTTAVLIAKIDTNRFIAHLLYTGGHMGESAEVNLIDQDGTHLTELKHPLPGGEKHTQPRHMKLARPALMALDGVEGIITDMDYRGKKVIAATRQIPVTAESAWGMVIKVDDEEVFEPLRRNVLFYVILSLLSALLVLGLTYMIATRLSMPLEHLSRTVRKIKAGDLTARSSLTTSDEIGSLSVAFDSMAEKIQRWNEELENQVKERTKQLMESERKYRDLFESATDAIFILDLQGNFIDVNRIAYTRLGYSKEEMLSMNISRLDPSEFAARVPERLTQISEHGFAVFESAHIRKDGTVMPVEVSSRLYDYDGRKVYFSHIRDITERKKVEKALKESERKYRRLHESMRDGYAYVSMDGIIRDYNESYRTMLGYASDELYRLTYVDITPEKWHALEKKIIEEQVLPKGYSEVYEKEYRKKDGTIFPVELRVFLLKNEKGEDEGMWAIVRDISERRKLEAQLLHAQKMESIGVLAGGIAHDFNNALTGIIGFAYILKSKLKDDEQLAHNAEQIISISNRAAMTVSSLLAFSRKQLINLRPVDLNGVVIEIQKLLKNTIGEDIEIIIKPCSGPLIVMADRAQIDQILINLATNARDAMPQGGILTFETDRFYLDEETAKTHVFDKPGHFGRLIVSDTGHGIDQQTMDMIFEPFFTTKEVGKGTGLGLAMVYGLIKQHDGNIMVSSEPGKGTVFKIYLPLIGSVKQEANIPRPAELKGGTETVLLAEDDENVRKILRTVLEHSGYTVITALDGEDAIAKFSRYKDTVRLCILDVVMPKKSGRAVFDEIKKLSPDIKALFISGYTGDVLNRQEILVDGLHFISKPVLPEMLLKKVHDILDSDALK